MSSGKDCKRNIEVVVGAGGLTSNVNFGVIGEHMHPSVGRFKANKTPFGLDVNGPPAGIKTSATVAQYIAPYCSYSVFKTKVYTTTIFLFHLELVRI